MAINLTLFSTVLRKLFPAEVDANFTALRDAATNGPGIGQIFTVGMIGFNTTTGLSSNTIYKNGAGSWVFGTNTGEPSENFNFYNYLTGGVCFSINKATSNVLINTVTDNGTGAALQVAGTISANNLRLEGMGTATIAYAGAATALPAQPVAYMRIFINGVIRKIPLYAD